jgi:hypothetical protein
MTEPNEGCYAGDLIDQGARARRLAITISGDNARPRLEQLAAELDAQIVWYSRTD